MNRGSSRSKVLLRPDRSGPDLPGLCRHPQVQACSGAAEPDREGFPDVLCGLRGSGRAEVPAGGGCADRRCRKSLCRSKNAVSLKGVKMVLSAIGNDQESLASI